MQYFVGKVCSIVTSSMNRQFDEKIAREHFAVYVEEVTNDGIWGTHPYNQEMISFFSMPHIISIHQEMELDPNNPEHAAMIEEYEKKTGQKVTGDLKRPPKPEKKMSLDVLQETPPASDDADGDTTFVDIANLEQIAEQTRRSYAAQDELF